MSAASRRPWKFTAEPVLQAEADRVGAEEARRDEPRERAPPAVPPPLFRPEAMRESEYGDALAFSVPRWRALALLAAGTLLPLLLFGLIADFDRVATVRGVVTPVAGVSRLVAPQPGIVTAVLVRQGAGLRRGEPMIRIASTALLPSGTAASAARLAAYGREQQIAREDIGVEARRADAERARLREQMAQLATTQRSLGAQAALQRERIASNELRLRNLAPLRERGYVSVVAYQQQEETVLTLRQQLAELEQRRAVAGHELGQLRLRSAELDAESRRATLRSAATLAELERGAADAQGDSEILLAAPVAGRVAALHVLPGRSVAAEEELATIVQSDALEATLLVPSSAVGALRPGQEVVIRFDAFPYQRYGVGRGVVKDIAATVSPGVGDGPPTYRVRVALERNGAPFALRPEMSLSASIVIERRTLVDWLLAPLRERWRERIGGGGA
ncbi:MAG TPA: HlyD family efflux transporter periplasmic adaptor subunit [Allosphingosinicella sp.]|nr:HlyD family efflux transporter periplasmic adaptor subunit [Allosphingosinicella sp.]